MSEMTRGTSVEDIGNRVADATADAEGDRKAGRTGRCW